MNAIEAYMAAQRRAASQIETLTAALAAHHDDTPCEGTNWGHVGDINHVNELLAEAIAFLTGAES